MTSTSIRDYYTVGQCAKKWGISDKTVYLWIDIGELPAERIGKRTLRVKKEIADTFPRAAMSS